MGKAEGQCGLPGGAGCQEVKLWVLCQGPLTRRPEGAEKSGEGGGGRGSGCPSWGLLGSKCYKVNLASLPFSPTNTRERCQDISSPASLLPFSTKFPEPTTVPSP